MNLLQRIYNVKTLQELADALNINSYHATESLYNLSDEEGFGSFEEFSYNTPDGFYKETHKINKRQAFRVAADLKPSLIIEMVDRMLELEEAYQNEISAHNATKEAMRTEISKLSEEF